MPIVKLNAVKRTTGQIPYTQIPNEIVYNLGSADAIALYVYLMCKPESWVVRKKDIMKALGIGRDRYTKDKNLLVESGLWTVAEVRNELGQIQGRVIWVNAVPTEVPENPHFGKTHITDNPHCGKPALIDNKDSLQ